LSLTLNKKVGTYIEKLREKNERLQKKLNQSLDQKNQLKEQLQ